MIGGRYIFFYPKELLDNGWQPYAQPHPDAYVPFKFDDFHKYECVDGGALFVQKRELDI